MDHQTEPADPYEAVIADLRRKRHEIDNAIAVIESVRGSPSPKTAISPAGATGQSSGPKGHPHAEAMRPGAFLGMTIADATKALLARERRQLGNAEVHKGLVQGGLALTSKDALNTIGSVLNRRFKDVGDIVRVGRGIWGLKEWYPGRSFKPTSVKGGEDIAGEPSEADLLGGFDTTEEEANAEAQRLENEFV